jgi:hypothetical protein
MVARDIAVAQSENMRDAAGALHAIVKTQKISPDEAARSITVEGNGREAGLAEWLIGELDSSTAAPTGHGYIMPHDKDDVTVVIGGFRLGAVSAGASRVATAADLQEVANAIRVLGDIPRTTVYAPSSVLVWRGKVWQSDFATWLLGELANPPAANWTAPVSHRLNQVSPNVRIFYFPPEPTAAELGPIVNSIRQKASAPKVVAINADRAIVVRGSDIETTAAEQIVAAARR